MKALESFEFISALITLQRSLFYFRKPAVKLPAENLDIVFSYFLLEQSCADLKELRANVDNYSHCVFQHACKVLNDPKLL